MASAALNRAAVRQAIYEGASADLTTFAELMLPAVSPADTFIDARHVHAIAYQLMRLEKGLIKRLLIAVPPRHQKSYLGSICFPAWVLGRDPQARIICASYSEDLALDEFALKSQMILRSETYRHVFPKARLSSKVALNHMQTAGGGYRMATSVGGKGTGFGADYIIVDDPMKYVDAASEAQRAKILDWVKGGLLSRFGNPAEGRALVIMQRLHNDDLIGSLVQDGGWTLLSLPGEFPDDRTIPLGNGRQWQVKAGDLLFPQLFPRTVLDQQRKEYGEDRFNAMILQRPSPPGGSIFKLKWFKPYDPGIEKRVELEMVVQSWDTAETDHAHSDYSVCTTWGIYERFFILLDVFRAQLPYHKLEKAVVEQRAKWKAKFVVMERAGVGRTICQQLRDAQGQTWIYSLIPKESKVLRAERETPKIEQGRVYLPQSAPWLEAFKEEVAAFPYGKHDDQVDSMTQILRTFDVMGPSHHEIADLRHSRDLVSKRYGYQ